MPGCRDDPFFSLPWSWGSREAVLRVSFPLGRIDLGPSQPGRQGLLRPQCISQAEYSHGRSPLLPFLPEAPGKLPCFPL